MSVNRSTVRATYVRPYRTGYIVVTPAAGKSLGGQIVVRDATGQTLVANDTVLIADEGLEKDSWVAIVRYPPLTS